MAGDWIKVEHSTPDKPEVLRLSQILGIERDAIVGKLLIVWIWFDRQSADGAAPVTLAALLDRYVGRDGFCDALVTVGWLRIDGDNLIIPNYSYHLGENSKKRAQTARRQTAYRVKSNANSNGASVTNGVTREEKRREEKKNPTIAPQAVAFPSPWMERNQFQDAWKDWETHRKETKKKLTPTSRKKQLSSLAKMGEQRAIEALGHSTANGYQGIYEPSTQGGKPTANAATDHMVEYN